MPDFSVSELITHLTAAQNLDNGRAAGDRLKLPATLRSDLDPDLADLLAKEQATAPQEGGRAGASAARRGALDQLQREHDGGYRFIGGLDEATITAGQRLQVFVSYGWASGEIGNWTDDRIISMARLAPTISATEAGNATWLYPAARLARIAAQLAIVDAAEVQATGGDAQSATLAREAARALAETTLFRIRCFYCSATRDADQTPELVKIGYQPRRDAGQAGGGGGGGTPLAVPAKAVLGSMDLGQDGNQHISTMVAARAAGFEVQYKLVTDPDFTTAAADAPGSDFHFPALPPGDYVTRVRGVNATGPGEWSDEAPFTLS